jgi:hypothetical protein
MAIASSTIIKQMPQCDGRAYVTELHIDHTGKRYEIEYLACVDADTTANLSARVAVLEQHARDSELRGYEQMVLDGVPVMPEHPPIYNSVSEVYAYLFNRFITETDPTVLLKAAGFTDLFSDEELSSYGLTTEMIAAVRVETDKIKQAAGILATFQPLGGN